LHGTKEVVENNIFSGIPGGQVFSSHIGVWSSDFGVPVKILSVLSTSASNSQVQH
jgi:hypothetical protein